MKKNNKGFFLAETIVVIALVTTVMAFVYPNVTNLYDNYKNRTNYYDQTEDLYLLRAYYEAYKETIDNKTIGKTGDCTENEIGGRRIKELDSICINKIGGIQNLYIISYMESPSSDNYNFNKYLKRIKKTTYDTASYRLIGVFGNRCQEGYTFNSSSKKCDKQGKTSVAPYEVYASIKIDNPNPSRNCNLGGK